MTEERRSAPRARISGARVTYESAAGDHVETDALNIGRGGLFVPTAKPLPVGKRITLEIQLTGEPAPWSALGRVVWIRERGDGPQRPSGMGVKLIDVEDAVLDAIDRLPPERDVAEQADVPRAVSGFKREATVLGVGAASEMATATPIVAIVPGGERTVLGVGTDSAAESEPVAAQEPSAQRASSPPHKPAPTREASVAREPSVVIDLVEGHPAKPPKTTGASEIPTVVKRRRGARWFLVFALLLLAGVGAYVLLGAEPERLQRLLGTPAPPAPSATASPQTSTTATIVSWPNASASASAHSLGSASSTATGHATAPAPATSSASARASTSASAPSAPASAPRPPKKPQPPAEDNPY